MKSCFFIGHREANERLLPRLELEINRLITEENVRGAVPFLTKLASASEVELLDSYSAEGAVSIVTDAATVYIPLSDLVDVEKEKARLGAELTKIEGEIKRVSGKLANEGFISKAPAAVVDAERAKLDKYNATREALLETLKGLS